MKIMRINTNVAALNAHRNLFGNDTSLGKTMEKLSSGFRINRAADDAAGLAISEKMRYQINGLNQAMRNAQDGISLLQTAEGALTEVHSMLQRMNTLANQAATGTYDSADDRKALQAEVNSLVAEINNIASSLNFNGIKLLNGTVKDVTFQIGVTKDNILTTELANMKADQLGITAAGGLKIGSINIDTQTGASKALAAIEAAIKQVSTQRGEFGAVQNRLEHTINNLGVTAENLSASESRIRDADMAQEMTSFTKQQILVQAGTAMLAQANARPQSVLQLLG